MQHWVTYIDVTLRPIDVICDVNYIVGKTCVDIRITVERLAGCPKCSGEKLNDIDGFSDFYSIIVRIEIDHFKCMYC